MKKKILFALLAIVAFSATRVYADDDYNPHFVTVNVEGLADFENIISNAPFDVEFTQRDERSVKVYGDPKKVDNVSLTVVGKTLYVGVKDENKRMSDDDVEVIITAPDLLCAIIGSSGDIDVKHLVNEKFTGTITSNGDIELTGSSDEAVFTINGSGDIDADEFRIDRLEATINGSGKIECICLDVLNANIVGSGEIELENRPRTLNVAGRKSGLKFDR